MSFRDAVRRRLGMDKKPSGHRGTEAGVNRNIEQAMRRDARVGGGMQFNPKAKLDPSQVEDRRPGATQNVANERRRREEFMKHHGPPSASTPDSQWDGRKAAIQRRQTRRK